jgi:hypothetical protein
MATDRAGVLSCRPKWEYTREDTYTQIRNTTDGYVLRHTEIFKKYMSYLVIFKV